MFERCVALVVPDRVCGRIARGGDGCAFGRAERWLAPSGRERDGPARGRRHAASARRALEALNLILIGSAVVPLTILGFVIWFFFRAAQRNDQRELVDARARAKNDGNSRAETL